MAAIAPPIAPAGAPAPTVVTVTGTIPGNDLAITFPATDPFVANYPTSMFILSAVAAGGAPQTASVPMGLAIRTWGGPLTFNDPAARNHVSTVSAFTFAFTGVAFSRILTELAASGLLDAGPFESQRDSDAALRALTAVNPANLAIQPDDFLALESLDQAAIAAVADVLHDRGSGRGRGRGAVAAAPAQTATPGPLNLAFMDMCSMAKFAEAQSGPCLLITFVRLLGALGPVATHASRRGPRTPAHGGAHSLQTSSALLSGVDAAAAAPPADDAFIFAAVPQTIDSGHDAPSAYPIASLETEGWSVQTEVWSGRPQLYLQTDTNRVRTWEEAQAEPSHDYTPVYQEEDPEGRTGTTVWSVLTSAQTKRMEQAGTHASWREGTEAEMPERTEATMQPEAQVQERARVLQQHGVAEHGAELAPAPVSDKVEHLNKLLAEQKSAPAPQTKEKTGVITDDELTAQHAISESQAPQGIWRPLQQQGARPPERGAAETRAVVAERAGLDTWYHALASAEALTAEDSPVMPMGFGGSERVDDAAWHGDKLLHKAVAEVLLKNGVKGRDNLTRRHRSSRAALAPTRARTSVRCEAARTARVQSQAAALWLSPCSLVAGLRWPLRWRAPR